MKLHAYLEQVLGTKAGISILRSLVKYKGKIFTVRGLARDAGVSSVEASRTIEQLEGYGIVKVQPVGRAYQVFLNDQSYVLNRIVKPILIAEEKTVPELIMILTKHLTTKKILSAVVFGSVAKGEEKEDSDIDLLVISDDFDLATGAVANASEEVALAFHSNVSPIIFTKKKFISKKNGDLVRSILSNHILVTGLDLEKLK
ncbi:MAG: nucleotidyltransferase domain-containing protein [Nitrosotalea sp.]